MFAKSLEIIVKHFFFTIHEGEAYRQKISFSMKQQKAVLTSTLWTCWAGRSQREGDAWKKWLQPADWAEWKQSLMAARERRRLRRHSLRRHADITKSFLTERRGWWKNRASKRSSEYWGLEEAGEAGGSRTGGGGRQEAISRLFHTTFLSVDFPLLEVKCKTSANYHKYQHAS